MCFSPYQKPYGIANEGSLKARDEVEEFETS